MRVRKSALCHDLDRFDSDRQRRLALGPMASAGMPELGRPFVAATRFDASEAKAINLLR